MSDRTITNAISHQTTCDPVLGGLCGPKISEAVGDAEGFTTGALMIMTVIYIKWGGRISLNKDRALFWVAFACYVVDIVVNAYLWHCGAKLSNLRIASLVF